jgi:hypothetical protein
MQRIGEPGQNSAVAAKTGPLIGALDRCDAVVPEIATETVLTEGAVAIFLI